MTQHDSFAAALAAIMALPGYVAHRIGGNLASRPAPNQARATTVVEYAQETSAGTGYRWRQALITEHATTATDEAGVETYTPTAFWLALPVVDETPEGFRKVITTLAGPDVLYPWVESIEVAMERNGSDAEPLDADKQPCAPGAAVWFRKTARLVLPVKSGIQQALGAWSRANEGDHFAIAIEQPNGQGGWNPVPTPDGGTVRFADRVVIHGTNTTPAAYPPNAPANLSWIPAGLAIRVDYFKKAANDPEMLAQRGPYADIDVILWRERVTS